MKIDHIYIIHYHQQVNRKQYLDSVLPLFNIPFEYRSLYDRKSPEIFEEKYFDQTNENRQKRNNITEKYYRVFEEHTGCPLHWGERALAYRAATLEHYKTYEHILDNTQYNNVLILEDDVRFKDNFLEKLDSHLRVIPDTCDICYIGSGCNLQLPYHTTNLVDKHPLYHSRCSDSYIVTRSALERIVKIALPFFAAIDWELNYIQAALKLNVYWSTDPITYQGSQHGYYKSSFDIN
jgi:GR25 family glycosyltransferase involved in LPS biosynthesis